MTKHTILFLAASPRASGLIDLEAYAQWLDKPLPTGQTVTARNRP